MPYITETHHFQTIYNNSIPDNEHKGPMMQPQSTPGFLVVLTFVCKALIACARQLNIMDEETGDGNYGTILAQSAYAIKVAVKEGKILATIPSVAFTQISQILEKEMNGLKGGIYSLFFDTVAKTFFRFRNDERLTAEIWLTALTSANKISEISEISISDRPMLNTLISAEQKLREALDSGLNSINAFGEAVKAAETFAMQTVHMQRSYPVNSTNHKTFKYPDPGAHAVGIWMRAAYEGIKLKFNCGSNL